MNVARETGLLMSLIVVVLGAPVGVSAQAREVNESAVLLFAPDEVRAEWTAALQLELAASGDRVVPASPIEGATVLLRDAAAQEHAIAVGARAAARVEGDAETGLSLRVIAADAERARATPIAAQADARTVALILVSLLDERDVIAVAPPIAVVGAEAELPAPPPPPPATTAPPDVLADAPAPIATAAAATESEQPEPERRWPEISGRIGTGGFGLVNDRRFIGGAMLRGGIGLRARYFEGAVLADAGLMLDSLSNAGSELQPLGRLCLEAGAAIPLGDSLAFHVGGRGCGGFAELRIVESDPFGGFVFTSDQMGALLSGGGYVALSFGLSDWARLYVRADVEGAVVESSMHFGEVLPVLSILVSFF